MVNMRTVIPYLDEDCQPHTIKFVPNYSILTHKTADQRKSVHALTKRQFVSRDGEDWRVADTLATPYLPINTRTQLFKLQSRN